MLPCKMRSTAITQVSAVVLLLAVSVMIIMTSTVSGQPLVVTDGDVVRGRTFQLDAQDVDLSYLYTSRAVSSTVQFIDCTLARAALLTDFNNPPATLVTSQYMKWVNTIIEWNGIAMSTLPPNSYTHSVGAQSPKFVDSTHHYIFYWTSATFAENVTLRVEDANIHFAPLLSETMITGIHTVIFISATTVKWIDSQSNQDRLFRPSRTSRAGTISDESFLYFENCFCVGCTQPIVYLQGISISRNSAMIFRNIISRNPSGSQPFFKCSGALTVDESSVFSLIDIDTADGFKANNIPLFDIKSIEGEGVIMFARVSMQKSGLTTLQPVNNDNFYVSAKATRSTGGEMTTAQLKEEKFNVNDANSMNWDGTDASGDCVQAGLAIPGRATYTKVDGNCTATCTDANMTALCTKPYVCLVPNCEICGRPNDRCFQCAPHTKPIGQNICECPMSPHCLVCPTKDKCTECVADYQFNKEGECVRCAMPFCKQCSTHNVCIECNDEYKPSADGSQCLHCNMSNCQQCSADDKCHKCDPNHKPANDGKDCFPFVIDKCQEYKEDGTCRTCNDGYKPSDDGKQCYQCPMPNCDYCTSDGICGECAKEYKLTENKKACFHCTMPHCTECSADGVCAACEAPHKPSPDDGQCYHCSITNCNYCTSDGVCGQCAEEYKLTNKNTQCFHCAMPHCTECSADGICMQCAEGYKPSADQKHCLQCTAPNCELCGTNNDCQRCNGGYTLTKNGECISCGLPGCLRCDVGGVCAMCDGDHSVSADGSGCVPCSMGNCTYCSSGGNCDMCACGMVPTDDGSSCVACSVANCVHCDLPGDGHACAECADGYALAEDGAVCKRVSMPSWVVFLIVVGATVVVGVAGSAAMFLYLRYRAKQRQVASDAEERRKNRQAQGNSGRHRTDIAVLDLGDIEGAANGVRDTHKQYNLKADREGDEG